MHIGENMTTSILPNKPTINTVYITELNSTKPIWSIKKTNHGLGLELKVQFVSFKPDTFPIHNSISVTNRNNENVATLPLDITLNDLKVENPENITENMIGEYSVYIILEPEEIKETGLLRFDITISDIFSKSMFLALY